MQKENDQNNNNEIKRDDFSATGSLPRVERTNASTESERDRKLGSTMTGTISTVGYQNASKADEKLPWYKRPLARKLRYALIALLVALTLWGYVLMSENPVRIKKVENVSVSFAGGNEADLKSRGLIISGDVDEVLTSVDVNVRTTLNDLPRFNNSALGDIVVATVNIGDIREPGTYTRRIAATSLIGAVESVQPSEVTITVENYVKRQIPVTCSLIGELPEGYWHDEPKLNNAIIEVPGPESVMSRVTNANCIIDLTGRTKSIFDSMPVELLDADGNVVEVSFVTESILACVVKMNILPYIDLSLDQYITTIGDMHEDYEISSISINPAYLSIAGQQSVLNSIPSSVSIEPINVSDFTSAGTYTQKVSLLGLPSDVTLLSDNNFIITIEVVDKIITTSLTCPINDANITGRDLMHNNYQFTSRNCIVTFTGPARLIRNVDVQDITVHLDLTDLRRGYNEVQPTITLASEPAWFADGSVEATVSTVVCIITSVSGN